MLVKKSFMTYYAMSESFHKATSNAGDDYLAESLNRCKLLYHSICLIEKFSGV